MIRIAMSNGWKRPRGSFQVADEGLRKHGCQRRPRGSFQVADRSLRKQAILLALWQIGDRYD